MNDPHLHDFFAPAAQHGLTAGEKDHIYLRLKNGIGASPLNPQAYEGSFLWRGLTGLFSSWAPVAAVVVILVLTGAGITSAESALPGDFLYPLKRVNERISTGIRFSAESKAAVQAEHLNKRLDEADALEATGRLTEKTTAELDQDYRLERREATQHIVELEAEGKQGVAAQMRARLNAVEDRYEKLFKGKRRETDPGDNGAARGIQGSIEGAVNVVNPSPEVAQEILPAVQTDTTLSAQESVTASSAGADASVNVNVNVDADIDALPLR